MYREFEVETNYSDDKKKCFCLSNHLFIELNISNVVSESRKNVKSISGHLSFAQSNYPIYKTLSELPDDPFDLIKNIFYKVLTLSGTLTMYSSKLNKLSSNNIRQISVKAFVKKNRENTSTVAVYSESTTTCQCYNPCATGFKVNGITVYTNECVNGNNCTSVFYIDEDDSCGTFCRTYGISDCSCGDCDNGNKCEDNGVDYNCRCDAASTCNCTGNEC